MTIPGAAAPDGMGHDEPVLSPGSVSKRPGDWSGVAMVERAVRTVLVDGVVLPATELSGFRGYPIIEWSEGLGDRLRRGYGPMLDRPTLSLWESWPTGVVSAPPSPVLRIIGFASTAPWRHALRAAQELRGFGATFVLTATEPSEFRLAEADVAGVYVIRMNSVGEEVLVIGEPGVEESPRMVAARYWEERLFAHALAAGRLYPHCCRCDPDPFGQ
jgi:hypothetical protein